MSSPPVVPVSLFVRDFFFRIVIQLTKVPAEAPTHVSP